MKTMNYRALIAAYPQLAVPIIQRLGYDARGERLRIDGIIGPKTRGGRYVDPRSVAHPLAECAMRELLAGVQEHGGNNRGPRVEQYQRGRAAELEPWMRGAWCASFVSWCLWHTYGDDAPYIRGARRLGLAVARDGGGELAASELEEGDLIIWDRDGPDAGDDPSDDWNGHVGIVVGRGEDGYLYTIEGNAEARRGAVRVYRFPESELDRAADEPFLFGARYEEE